MGKTAPHKNDRKWMTGDTVGTRMASTFPDDSGERNPTISLMIWDYRRRC